MKAKFVFENLEFERGRDPKNSMGIGADGEVQKVGYYEKFGNDWAPVQLPAVRSHELFQNWKDWFNNTNIRYTFRYKGKDEDDWYTRPKEYLEGKSIIYDGKIYTIPKD